jgi:Domain of unknown function (DUF4845)
MNPIIASQLSRLGAPRALSSPAKQEGASFITILIYFVVGAFFVLLVLKLFPVYMEYFAIKKVIATMGNTDEVRIGTVGDIRRSFDKRAQIDDIKVIKGADLEITKESGSAVVTAAWQHPVPLFTGYTLIIDFNVSTGSGSPSPGN